MTRVVVDATCMYHFVDTDVWIEKFFEKDRKRGHWF